MTGKKKLALSCSAVAGVWALIYFILTYFFAGGIPVDSQLIGVIAIFLLIIIAISGILGAYLIRTNKSYVVIEILLVIGIFAGIIRAAILGGFPVFWFLNLNNILLLAAAILLFLEQKSK